MLLEATIAMLTLMGGMWAAAVWASFQEDSRKESRSDAMKTKVVAYLVDEGPGLLVSGGPGFFSDCVPSDAFQRS